MRHSQGGTYAISSGVRHRIDPGAAVPRPGRTEFYLPLLPFIYWSIARRLALRAILMLLLVDLAGSTCKLLFHQPRPYWIGGVKAWSEGPSYGIPSTHASDSPGGGGD